MAKLGSVKIDSSKSLEGIWVNWVEDIELRITRLSNPDFTSFYRRATKAYTRGGGDVPDKVAVDTTMEGMAYHVLVDWKNIEDDDGNDIPYSPEQALEFFKDKDLEDLFTFVLRIAKDEDLYRVKDDKEAAKN